MRKYEFKEGLKEKRFYWFANDADGLSMLDFLTLIFIFFYVICKAFELICCIFYAQTEATMSAIAASLDSIESLVGIIITYYFVKKGIDSTVSKIVLQDKYKEMYNDVIRTDLAAEQQKQTETKTSQG